MQLYDNVITGTASRTLETALPSVDPAGRRPVAHLGIVYLNRELHERSRNPPRRSSWSI